MVRVRRRWRTAARPVALCVAALAVAGTVAAAAPPAWLGQTAAKLVASVAKVPWRQAGPGWSVVEYTAATLPRAPRPALAKTIFYLVSPAGRKYVFYRAPAKAAWPTLSLIDWSGDRQRILVQVVGSGVPGAPNVLEQISLATGTVVSRFELPNQVNAPAATQPVACGQTLANRAGAPRHRSPPHC